MNDKLILLKSILLLYRESLLPGQNKEDGSSPVIRKAIDLIKKADINIGITRDADIVVGLKDTVVEMINNPNDYIYIKEDLLSRINVIIGDTTDNLYEVFYDAITADLDEFKLKQSIYNERRTLAAHVRADDISKIVKEMYTEIVHNKDKISDFGKWVAKHRSSLETFEMRLDEKDQAISDEFDIDNEEETVKVASAMAAEIDGDLGFIFGWQDINDMVNGAVRRGENVVIPALQHNYKSGFNLSLFIQMCLFNTPKMLDPTKIPLMLHISFEDSVTKNLQFVYKYLYENETNTVIDEDDIAKIDPNIIAKFVKERLQKTGYRIKFLKVDPLSWTLGELFNKVILYESQGYELHCISVDYLPKLPTTGCTGNNGSEEYRNLLERFKQFFFKRKAVNMTPWQISPDAKEMIRAGSTDFVKLLYGRGYYAGSKQIDQVIDVEISIHKEVYKNESFLTVQGGKLRRVQKPTEDKTYRVYKFIPGGCIPWDLNKPNSARLKVGGETVSQMTDSGDDWDKFGEI